MFSNIIFVEYSIFGIVCFTIGILCGSFLLDRFWRKNADALWRIESRGKLFKVFHADTFKELRDETSQYNDIVQM